MTDKKILAFLIVCAAIMAGTIVQVTQYVSDGNSNSDGSSMGMKILTGDAVANATQWTSGDCTVTWNTEYDSIIVSGNGRMQDYSSSQPQPWISEITLSVRTIDISDGVTYLGAYSFANFQMMYREQKVTINSNSLTSIGDSAFMQSNIGSITISNSVTTIGEWAFDQCGSLTSVTIGNSVQTIGQGAFRNCESLTSVTIPDSVTSIGTYAFQNCDSLASVDLGSVTSIGNSAFTSCTSLTSMTIPSSVTSIGDNAFRKCTSLINIFFLGTSWTITNIGNDAFSLGSASSGSVSATVHSPNNVANGQLDAYKGDYTTMNYVASVLHTYTINVNDATYGSVSPASVQIYDGTSVVTDGNRLVFTDGQTVTATPAQSTSHNTYAFDDWTLGNLTQTANFTRTPVPHTVTFLSSDASAGTVSTNTLTIRDGTTYSANGNVMTFSNGRTVTATPSPATVQYTYAFDSWSSASGTVEQDMTITANFTRTVNQYTVTIAPNNTEYGTVSSASITVDYGTSISASGSVLTVGSSTSTATPASATVQYTYAFGSWSGIPSEGMVTGDVTVTANFTRELVNYTVTFAVNDPDYGSVSPGSAVLPYGTTIEAASGDPARLVQYPPDAQSRNLAQATPAASTEQYSYVFDSWSGIPESITGDVTVIANFSMHVSYMVTFAVNNAEFGSVQYGSLWIQEGSVPTVDGNTITFVGNAKQNTAIASQATDAYFYSFESWTGVPQQITGDVTITAQFVRADKMNVDVLAKEVIDIDVSQRYSGATEHHQTDYGDWISLVNGHLKGTVPADITDGHYYLVWWAKESLPRADWTAYYVMLHPTDSKTVQLSQDAEQTVHSDGKVQILGRGVMSNQMARLLDPYKEIVNVVDIRGLTTVQYMPAISSNYILVLGDSVTGFKDESNNHFDAIVIGGGINTFTVTGFHAYDKDGKEITGSALRGRVLIEQRTMQYEEIGITEVDNHYHNATCYAVQGSTLDNSVNDRIKFSVTGAGSIPQYILDLLAHSGQSWNVQMQSGSSFKNVTIDTEGVLQGVQSNSVGTYTGTQSALFTNTDYGAMYSCTMSQAIAFQVFVQYKLVIN